MESEKLTVAFPKSLKLELDAILECGYYKSISEFLKEATNTLLMARKDLRVAISCELYKNGKISLGKACEIIGDDIEEVKKLFVERSIPLRRGAETEKEIEKELEYLKG